MHLIIDSRRMFMQDSKLWPRASEMLRRAVMSCAVALMMVLAVILTPFLVVFGWLAAKITKRAMKG